MVPHVLLTGFGPFEDVAENPSGLLAEALGGEDFGELTVSSAVLPVTFRGAGEAWDAHLANSGGTADVFLSLGVHPGEGYRLERRARGLVGRARPDTEGFAPSDLRLGGDEEYRSTLDVERLAVSLEACGAGAVEVSEDAGLYVCERTYHHLLRRGAEQGVPGLFLHVPSLSFFPLDRQIAILRAWLPALAASATR